ncbi:hypothetical protein MRX96_019512 [Rhipicephalus microplus]
MFDCSALLAPLPRPVHSTLRCSLPVETLGRSRPELAARQPRTVAAWTQLQNRGSPSWLFSLLPPGHTYCRTASLACLRGPCMRTRTLHHVLWTQ